VSATVRLLIAALGGEGGGVLAGWIVAAAHAQGLAVQATSVPGVAQRTGATTYYLEFAERPKDGSAPVFALMPVEGGVDIVAASELMEAARMVERGYVTPDRTFLIASTHRVLTVPEKSARGAGTFSAEKMIEALEARSRDRLLFDMQQACREANAYINAVMLGAIAGLKLLPIDEAKFLAAIEAGRGAAANLRGFKAGLAIAGAGAAPAAVGEAPPTEAPTPAHLAQRIAAMPAEARDMARIGVSRLVDYQGRAYAGRYLDRLEPFRDDGPLTRELARHLAVRMSYEDIIRVAQLKVRPERFARVRAELGVAEGEPFQLVDFFKPGIPEFADLMPPMVGRRLLAWADKKPGRADLGIAMSVRTTTLSGFLRLWLLARLRFWRRFTLRHRQEQAEIEAWLALIDEAKAADASFAAQVCDLGRLVKGYGDTRRRAVATYEDLVARLVRPALEGKTPANKAARELKGEIERVLAGR
jgi:indolepyruvate ferredoxin oxidoreductase beta subunit